MSEEVFNNFVTNVCQYFPPKDSNKRKKSSKLNDRENQFDLIRKQLLLKTFAKIDSKINEIRNDLFSPLMQSLFGFISDNCLNNEMREKCFKTKFKANTGLIPTALLSIGMNSSEHKYICDLLVESIQDLTTFVVYLNSNQNQSMNSVFKQISDTILTEEVIESASLDEYQIKRQTFESVFKLFEEFVIKSNDEFCSPIIIFLDEIENFDHSLITSLILIIKEYLQTIPFVLIMVKSNETISLQNLLPSNATDLLLIHPFHSFCGHKIVDQLIEKLLIESSLTFKLGPNVLEFMAKMFKNFDFSIQNIQNFIKCCLFEHFYSNELSFLCQSVSDLKTYVKNNDMKSMKDLRDSKLFDFSLDVKAFNKSLVKSISEFISLHKQFVKNLKLLLTFINSNNPNISLTKLYTNFINKSFDCKQITDSLNRLSQNQWKIAFNECFTESCAEEKSKPLIDVLKSCHKSFIEATNEDKSEPQVLIERLDVSDMKNKLSNLKTRHQWKETINPLNKPKILTKFEIWKKTAIDLIEETINEIPKLLSSPLNEIIFFDDLDSLKSNVFTVLRNDIYESLSNSLEVSDKKEGSKQVITDFNRLFVIYMESHSIFNVFDSFKTFEESLEASNTKTNKNNEIVDQNIVRFVNTVSDFEYMGLIGSAKHKTDHLVRLVWF